MKHAINEVGVISNHFVMPGFKKIAGYSRFYGFFGVGRPGWGVENLKSGRQIMKNFINVSRGGRGYLLRKISRKKAFFYSFP